jgi:carboxyl-terminal processing protease
LNDQFSAIYGNLVGLGVDLRAERDSLLIVRVIPGSPAEEGGLKKGDRILAVDGTSLRGKENAADMLTGEEGTTVKLAIISDGAGQRQRELSFTRRHIEVPSVEDVRMINAQLGYVKLTGFQTKTCSELTKALNDLNRQDMKCLILDLRQNPGGLFHIGVEVANMFIEQGAIVRTRGRERGLDSPCMATPGNTWHVPLIVLIDEESASASEIVAGAIRDDNRGTLIGKQSYGKGTIQKIIPVQTGSTWNVHSGVKLTTEKFYSPQGWAYSGVGVTPHITVKEEEKRVALKPWEVRLPLPLSRAATSSLDDPFIQEAVKESQKLVK